MSYFLAAQPLEPGATLTLSGAEADHLLKSRRMRPGERFALQDPAGARFVVELLGQAGRTATVRVLEPAPVPAPPPCRVTLVQAAVKEKAAEWIVQKATELGVATVRFFPAERSTVPTRLLAAPRTRQRWERIAWEACKQSDRPAPPALEVAPNLAEALAGAEAARRAWLLHPLPTTPDGAPVPEALAADETALALVGPEGGFTEAEVTTALAAGLRPVRLGGRALRAETAALAACTLLLYGAPVARP